MPDDLVDLRGVECRFVHRTDAVIISGAEYLSTRRRLLEAESNVQRLLDAIAEYRLWRPCEKGHAAAHRKLMAVLDD